MEVLYVDIAQQYRSNRSEILAAVDRVLSSGNYILGQEVETFETQFAKICGAKYAIGVANGTDSLVMCLRAFGIGPGDEVITAPNSWISSASCIGLVGATPVFVDVNEDQNMNARLLEKAVTKRTKAIIPVHLTGKSADMNPILEIAKSRGLKVIEDAAQAIGAKYHGKNVGSLGDAASFSLHPLKNLNACGDAGILTTNSDELAQKLRLLRNHGLETREKVKFWGYNSRLDPVQAAILNVRLPQLDHIITQRRKNAELYRSLLSKPVICPTDGDGCFDVYHLFVIQAPQRDSLKQFLFDKGIQTAIHYPVPIHLQEAAAYLRYKTGDFPEVEAQSHRILSLPIHQGLTEDEVRYVAAQINEFFKG